LQRKREQGEARHPEALYFDLKLNDQSLVPNAKPRLDAGDRCAA
jgi:hypothetical protein